MQSQMGRRAGCRHLGSQGANLWKRVVSSGNSFSASSRKPRSQPLLQKGFLRCPGSRLLTQNVTVANQCKGQRLSQSVADVFISSFPLEECSHTPHPASHGESRRGSRSALGFCCLLTCPRVFVQPGKLRRGSSHVIYLFLRGTCDSPGCCVSCEIVYRPAPGVAGAASLPALHVPKPDYVSKRRAGGHAGCRDEPASPGAWAACPQAEA